ncbi:DUF350 domain-containing protein [Aliikangiella marina]|uniref:DUF350 domain-containing protein n=1 Tax=Aliikangiella marina TaxID=1712262 RepID=A0A545TGY2_9GAMM|nr:DUF350 domain-containing protein [Aliikangiella marina]TQV76492.1 DUF350 domain-containing protein [Aliikangiella marina]
MNFNEITIWEYQVLALDLVVIILLLISMRFLKGFFSKVHTLQELKERNNAAFGISYAGGILALAIMLTGVASGEVADTVMSEVTSVAVFGLLGLVMIMAGRQIQDRLVLRQLDIHGELVKGNLASAFVDVGHMLAVGLIVRAAMLWIPVSDFSIIPVLLAAFVLAQVVMMVASLYRIKLFKVRNQGELNCLQTALAAGNSALALRYGAFMVGAALAVTTATGLAPYSLENVWLSVAIWSAASLIAIVAFAVIVMIVRKLVLAGIDVAEEVDQENNAGVAAIESAIFVGMGLILVTLFG